MDLSRRNQRDHHPQAFKLNSKVIFVAIGGAIALVVCIQVALIYPFLSGNVVAKNCPDQTQIQTPPQGQQPQGLRQQKQQELPTTSGGIRLYHDGKRSVPIERDLKGIPVHPPPIPQSRAERFPSVQERVRIYMTDWYVPPCQNNTDGFVNYKIHEHKDSRVVGMENQWQKHIQFLTEVTLERFFSGYAADFVKCKKDHSFPQYCTDIVAGMMAAIKRVQEKDKDAWDDRVPVNMHIGDLRNPKNTIYMNLPHIKKFRMSMSPEEVMRKTSQECHVMPRPIRRNRQLEPIVWKLNVQRHYGSLTDVYQKDIPWSQKKSMAIFRGKYTGPTTPGFTSEAAICFGMPRCHLVYTHKDSKLVDAKLTDKIRKMYGGVEVLGKKMAVPELLKYKAIIMEEGNDVATGLKWALLSNSVVLMTPPTKMTYAMEDQLVPWVHYVPLLDDFSDVEEKTQWVLDNDAYAEQIAIRASYWIKDLVEHPDSDKDHGRIEEEILRRYQVHFKWQDDMQFQPRTH